MLVLPIADVVWAGLALTFRWESVPVIAASLVIEWPLFKFAFGVEWRRALWATLIANLASFTLGFVLLPLGTMGWEFVNSIVFRAPTFAPANEVSSSLVAALICTLIEYPAAKWFLKQPWQWKACGCVLAANVLTVGLAATYAFWLNPPKM